MHTLLSLSCAWHKPHRRCSEEFSVGSGMESRLSCHDTWPHLGSEGDKVVKARLLGFALGSHVRTRTAVRCGLVHRDPGEHGPLRSLPCPLLPLQALDFIPSQQGAEKNCVLSLSPRFTSIPARCAGQRQTDFQAQKQKISHPHDSESKIKMILCFNPPHPVSARALQKEGSREKHCRRVKCAVQEFVWREM